MLVLMVTPVTVLSPILFSNTGKFVETNPVLLAQCTADEPFGSPGRCLAWNVAEINVFDTYVRGTATCVSLHSSVGQALAIASFGDRDKCGSVG